MNHTFNLDTVSAMLICQALNEDNFINELDKKMATGLKEELIDVVAEDLRKNERRFIKDDV